VKRISLDVDGHMSELFMVVHLEKANNRTKQDMISKLIAKLPDEYVMALDFAYDLYKTESKEQS
jgi:hypothetical protein